MDQSDFWIPPKSLHETRPAGGTRALVRRATSAKDVAVTLWRMAQEYQQKAARLDSGKLPDIGEKPSDV
jgi:hypothetical protein